MDSIPSGGTVVVVAAAEQQRRHSAAEDAAGHHTAPPRAHAIHTQMVFPPGVPPDIILFSSIWHVCPDHPPRSARLRYYWLHRPAPFRRWQR